MAKEAKPKAKKRNLRSVPAVITMRWQGMSREIESIREYLLTVTSSFRKSFANYEKHLQKQAESASEDEMQDIGADWSQAKAE